MLWKNGTWKKMVRPVTMLLIMITLFTYVSFSWMRREWTPTIEQTGITIATSGSLVFQMGEGSEYTDGKTINEIVNLKDFYLIPVSNCTGETDDFFKLEQTTPGQEMYVYLDKSDYGGKPLEMGKNNGYLEFKFQLHAPDGESGTRYIYLHEDSKIENAQGTTGDPASCVRVSISQGTQSAKIFRQDATKGHTGITNEKNGDNYAADGLHYYIPGTYDTTKDEGEKQTEVVVNGVKKALEVSTVAVHDFDEYSGKTDGKYDPAKAMFQMTAGLDAANPTVEITVRVWIEGTDPNCESSISNGQINLLIKFASFTSAQLQNQ